MENIFEQIAQLTKPKTMENLKLHEYALDVLRPIEDGIEELSDQVTEIEGYIGVLHSPNLSNRETSIAHQEVQAAKAKYNAMIKHVYNHIANLGGLPIYITDKHYKELATLMSNKPYGHVHYRPFREVFNIYVEYSYKYDPDGTISEVGFEALQVMSNLMEMGEVEMQSDISEERLINELVNL
jgi:hypothetical protein